jgi:hypothetical protein
MLNRCVHLDRQRQAGQLLRTKEPQSLASVPLLMDKPACELFYNALRPAGDSRCVLARRSSSGGTEAIQMTWDAKPDHPDEMKRIRGAGECGLHRSLW